MKAPDKIYIDDLAVVNDCMTKNSTKPLPNFSEYIRKDALLEWLQPRANELKQRWLANPADKEAFCKEQVFSSILDKIKMI